MKLIFLLASFLLLPAQLDPPPYTIFLPAVLNEIPLNVVVTNSSDSVNGTTGDIKSLQNNPGPDGISFREAFQASNGTTGMKTILFAPSLKGATIILGSGGITSETLTLTSGQLTINGDIDNDGNPDITLDGSLGSMYPPISSGLTIWSSHNKIQGLKLVGFNTGISTASPGPNPALKTIVDNQILGNIITSTYPGAAGMEIGVMGLISNAEAYLASDLRIQDTLIDGNTITVNGAGIGVRAGVSGASRNQIINTTISYNHITSEAAPIGITAADTSSDYFGVPGPIRYSDNNLIDQVSIVNNTIYNGGCGVCMFAGNMGDQGNELRHVQISNNSIKTLWVGIMLEASIDSGKERSTSYNTISDIQIDHNTIRDPYFGMLVGAGDFGPNADPFYKEGSKGLDHNTLSNVQITDNNLTNYYHVGIRVWGGSVNAGSLYSTNNLVDQISITGNTISSYRAGSDPRWGIELLGSESFDFPTSLPPHGFAQGNTIQGAVISNNTVRGNTYGISLIGGRGNSVTGNLLIYKEMTGNDTSGNATPTQIQANVDGASGNSLINQP